MDLLKRASEIKLNNKLIKNKKGSELDYDVIFIIIATIFIIGLFVMISSKGKGAAFLEESYAKNIALLIDAGKPNMLLKLKMEDGFSLAEKNNIPFKDMVTISKNSVKVKLSQNSGYEYSFFNDVQVNVYPDTNNKQIVISIIKYNLKQENE